MSDSTSQPASTDGSDNLDAVSSRFEQRMPANDAVNKPPEFGPVAEFFLDLAARLLMFGISFSLVIGIMKVLDYFQLFDFASKG